MASWNWLVRIYNLYSITKLKKCPVKTKKSHHVFYNQSVVLDPNMKLSVSKIVGTNKNSVAFNPQSKKTSISTTLPFKFPFCDVNFKEILISPMGFITFKTSEPNVQTASIIVYLNNSDILKNILHCIVTFGSTTNDLEDFVIKWNHSYEAILHKDGRVDLKYYNVPRQ